MGILWGTITNKPFWQWSYENLGIEAKSGVQVTHNNALSSSAYYSGVSLIAQTMAQVPLMVYRRLDRGKERAVDHNLYHVLHDEPNEYMAACTFKEVLQGHILTWGNAFAYINWEGDVIQSLIPLRPVCVQINWDNGKLSYTYTLPNGEQAAIKDSQMLHIPGFGFDGIPAVG